MRKILCVVLCFLLIITSTFMLNVVWAENVVDTANETNTSNETNSGTETNTTTDLQTQQKELQDQIEQANGELSDVQSDLSENLQQVQKLDEKIESSEKELEELTQKVDKLKTSMQEIETKLEEETQKYETQKALFEERMVAIYEAGQTQYLDILLNSTNVSDFLSSYYVMSEIAENDAELLNNLGEKKDEIALAKQKLENERDELATIVENQTRIEKVLKNTKLIRETFIAKLSEEEKEKQAQIDEYNKALAEVNSQIVALAQQGIDTQYIGGTLAWPVPGYTRISSQYGMRVHPITKVYKLHTGVDISAPMGANFVAANDGLVVKAEYNTAYGNMVVIDHGGGISTLYAHGSEFLVKVGDTVTRGQAVLKVGSTGYSTGPHAHFEVRKNGVVTNPMPYITNGIVPNSEEDSSTRENNNTSENKNTSENSSDEQN